MDTWTVVRFPEENTVEVVPTVWLNKGMCYWPPYTEAQLKDAIGKQESPEPEWSQYQFTHLRNNVFVYYIYPIVSKTQPLVPLLIPTSPERTLPATILPVPTLPVPIASSLKPNYKGLERYKTAAVQPHPTEDSKAKPDLSITYMIKIVKDLALLKRMVAELAEKIESLEHKLKHKPDEEEAEESMFTNLNLPVNSDDDMEVLEQYLLDPNNMKAAIRQLCSFGGKTIYEFIYRASEKIITN
ncbi:unnamed protein product [Brassicogethes aeneus]|uniref:Uncharacterized protein n=1 Tax=Brassicogethes aeneus TaxID=1431903 RepID=A0A9P0BF38_BRAAE|nr:unnamed protein product [Brassicogethes aeneus]